MKLYPALLLLSFLTITAYGKTILESGTSDFFTIQKSQDGNEIEVEVFDLKGKLLSTEKILMEKNEFKSYSWSQLQTGDKVELELIKNKLHFKSENKKKTIELSEEELNKIVLPPLLTNSLVERIKKSPGEKKFDVTVIVPDKMMTLNFNFERLDKNNDQSVWVLRPNSFFVGLIVGPLTITFNKDLKLIKIKDIMLPIKPTQKTDILFK
jgi:hypothetical protein